MFHTKVGEALFCASYTTLYIEISPSEGLYHCRTAQNAEQGSTPGLVNIAYLVVAIVWILGDLRKIVWNGLDWIHLTQDRDRL
jgi:hypothetical protein